MGSLVVWLTRRASAVTRERFRRAARRSLHDFRTRLARYHLQDRRLVRAALATDPVVEAAVATHAREHGLPEPVVRRQVDRYVQEIVPYLSVLSYYKIGYNLAKLFVNLLFKVSVAYTRAVFVAGPFTGNDIPLVARWTESVEQRGYQLAPASALAVRK